MKTFIYGLRCPIKQQIRYIGKSIEPEKRLKNHCCQAKRLGTYKERWIALLLRSGLAPEVVILQEVEEGEDWGEIERGWISKATQEGWPLTNTAAGGEGSSPLNEQALKRKIELLARPETRERMRLAARARWDDKEKREKGLAALRTPEARKKKSLAAKAREASSEMRELRSRSSKAIWQDPEVRDRILAGITEETRKKVALAAKSMWSDADTEKRTRMLANLLPCQQRKDE